MFCVFVEGWLFITVFSAVSLFLAPCGVTVSFVDEFSRDTELFWPLDCLFLTWVFTGLVPRIITWLDLGTDTDWLRRTPRCFVRETCSARFGNSKVGRLFGDAFLECSWSVCSVSVLNGLKNGFCGAHFSEESSCDTVASECKSLWLSTRVGV